MKKNPTKISGEKGGQRQVEENTEAAGPVKITRVCYCCSKCGVVIAYEEQPCPVCAARQMVVAAGVVGELLRLQWEQDKWRDEMEASGQVEIREPISGNWLLLHLALDMLGVPKDNSSEACEIANETGEWPEWGYCRDVIVDVYRLMVEKRGDIEGYIEVVTGKRELPPGGWSKEEQLEAYLYP